MPGVTYVARAAVDVLASRTAVVDAVCTRIGNSAAPVTRVAAPFLNALRVQKIPGWICYSVDGQQAGDGQGDGQETHF